MPGNCESELEPAEGRLGPDCADGVFSFNSFEGVGDAAAVTGADAIVVVVAAVIAGLLALAAAEDGVGPPDTLVENPEACIVALVLVDGSLDVDDVGGAGAFLRGCKGWNCDDEENWTGVGVAVSSMRFKIAAPSKGAPTKSSDGDVRALRGAGERAKASGMALLFIRLEGADAAAEAAAAIEALF